MSDYIPFEIQAEIIKLLPIKPLIQFRSVSKQWNSLITSSKFIADYHNHHTNPPNHLFITNFDDQSCKQSYDLYVNNNTFHIQNFSLTVPVSVIKPPIIIASNRGLFSMYNCSRTNMTVVIWNPTIRKSVVIDLDHMLGSRYGTILGFGVSPRTLDPMIVKVTFLDRYEDMNVGNVSSDPWQVEVYTLSTKVWRSPLCSSNLPRETIQLTRSVVDIDGFIYFLAFEWIVFDRDLHQCYLIISFDMESEEFSEIRLPNSLAYESYSELGILKLTESLAVFEFVFDDDEYGKFDCNVWMMENDVEKSFKKLFTINSPNETIQNVHGFGKNGEPIIQVMVFLQHEYGILVYEPDAKHMSYVGISGRRCLSFVNSYVETLLLLNH